MVRPLHPPTSPYISLHLLTPPYISQVAAMRAEVGSEAELASDHQDKMVRCEERIADSERQKGDGLQRLQGELVRVGQGWLI